MHSPERNFTGNDTTSEIILFEVPLNRHSSTGGVGIVSRECPRAKAESWELLKGYKRELHTGTNKTMMCQLPIAC